MYNIVSARSKLKLPKTGIPKIILPIAMIIIEITKESAKYGVTFPIKM